MNEFDRAMLRRQVWLEDKIDRLKSLTGIKRRKMDVHTWFSLTYASYLVLPRSIMQGMPLDWQYRFTAILDELHDKFDYIGDREDYQVQLRRLVGEEWNEEEREWEKVYEEIDDPLSKYRHIDVKPYLRKN